MNAPDFQRLAAMFDEAASGGGGAPPDEIEALLRHDRSLPAFLTDDGVASLALVREWLERMTGDGEDPVPDQVAGYPILGVLGAGGSGVVYRARQFNPAREVALKVLRPGAFSASADRRFAFEAEALGRLNHPGIAQIHDAGTWIDHGAAAFYLAIELVDGQPLSRFGRERNPPLVERLRLFLGLCDAVEHAHQNGVIHRDLKPANILVTPDGRPKIVDFGIARSADTRATLEQTGPGELVGTLPYMSPEQLSGNGEAIDTRTDVYALGVVLFEFLTGRLPFDLAGQGLAEAARTIAERPPRRLTDAAPGAPADLATIVDKSISKDPALRYQSARELGADIRRFLEDRPIEARPAGAWYRLRKFARRNRALTGAIGAAAIILLGATAGISVLAVAALRAEHRADRRFGQVRELARAFLFDVYDRIADTEGTLEARHSIVSTALRYLDALAAEAGDDPALLHELAAGYTRLGDVQGNRIASGHLGDPAGAVESYAKAERLLDAVAPSWEGEALRAEMLEHRAALVRDLSNSRGAIADIERAVGLRRRLAEVGSGAAERRALHASLELRVAVARYSTMPAGGPPADEDMAYAERCEREADAYAATIDPDERADPWRFAHLTTNPGGALRRQTGPGVGGPRSPPVGEARAAMEERRRAALAQPGSVAAQSEYYESLMLLGAMLIVTGSPEPAVYEEAAKIADTRRLREPLDQDARAMAAQARSGIARSLLALDRGTEALDAARAAHELAKDLRDPRPLHRALAAMIAALTRLGRAEDAMAAMRGWLAIGDPPDPEFVGPAAELAALILRRDADDEHACAEAGMLCAKALAAMPLAGRPGGRAPPGRAALRERLAAVRDSCAKGDRTAALRIIESEPDRADTP